MKAALELCSLATNSSAPSPTAGMVKVEKGMMVAFGGLFCIRVPIETSLECAFNPVAVRPFFRKERKVIKYTIKKNKLVIEEGKERLSVGCLPPDEMVTLDVIAPVHKTTFQPGLLRYMAGVIDAANVRRAAHGVTLRGNHLFATNGRIIIAALTDEFPDDMEFNIHKDACVALAKFKSKVVGISADQRAVKFLFEDGSSFTTLKLIDKLPDVMEIFKDSWIPLDIDPKVQEDLAKIDCFAYGFEQDKLSYYSQMAGDMEGELDVSTKFDRTRFLTKETFDYMLKNGGKLSYSKSDKIRSVKDNVCIISTFMVQRPQA